MHNGNNRNDPSKSKPNSLDIKLNAKDENITLRFYSENPTHYSEHGLNPPHLPATVHDYHELLFLVHSANYPLRHTSVHKKSKDIYMTLLSGAIAGGISKMCTAPLERLKILYQIQTTAPQHSLFQSFLNIYKEGGIPAYFQGNLAALLKVVPENAVKFFAYETIKKSFSESDMAIKPHERLIAGALAGAIADCAVFPLEVIKTHLTIAKPGTYKSILHTFETIRATEDSIRPFYRGLSASLLSTIPHTSINFTSYELLKNLTLNVKGELGVKELLFCAWGSSAAGQLLAYPFHLVKTRMISKSGHYRNVIDVFKKTFVDEGFRGLYRGLLPSFIKSVPSHGLTFLVYEYFKRDNKLL